MEISSLIKIHLLTVIPALFLGLALLIIKKGTRLHKSLGRIWAALMIITSIVSLLIADHGLSWLHLLSILTLVSVFRAVTSIRYGNVTAHQRAMVILYISTIIAGFFAVAAPGRIMHNFFFSILYN